MDGLPVLVVYGAVLWKVVLAVLVAIVLAIVAVRRARRALRHAREDAARRAAGAIALEAGAGTFRGKLTRGSASTLVQGERLTDYRADELWLDHHGDRVELLGDLRIDHGARAWTSWLRPTLLRNVREGDEVIVSGTLARSSGDASYRESAASWTLSSVEWVTAARPAAAPRPLGPLRWSAVALGVALACCAPLFGAGLVAKGRLAADGDRIPGAWSASSIAAALPGSRDAALDHLDERLGRPRSEAELQRGLALDELRGACPAARLASFFRLEQALDAARRCGTAEQVARMLAFLGRFAEIDLAATGSPAASARLAIAGGRWSAAAAGAELVAERLRTEAPTKDVPDDWADRRVLRLRCLAALFRVWAGEPAAFERVPERAADTRCSALAALGLPVAAQAAALARIGSPDDESTDLLGELRIAAGGPPRNHGADDFVHGSLPVITFDWAWLAPFAIAARPSGSPWTYAELSMLAALRGDFAAARRELARSELDDVAYSLELMIALREGASPFPPPRADAKVHPGIEDAVALRRGMRSSILSLLHSVRPGCTTATQRALSAAVAGDGAPLADLFQTCPSSWGTAPYWGTLPTYLIAILPRVTSHREQLAAALRLYRDEFATSSYWNIPFPLIQEIALYRDLARIAGDREEAAAMQQLFERHAAMLADRQKVIAFLFWNELT